MATPQQYFSVASLSTLMNVNVFVLFFFFFFLNMKKHRFSGLFDSKDILLLERLDQPKH